mmetsp:Transcript_113868/g.362007  ORF Transcript_113868/g.362007 Transcript_113868/m.362007 type:complete len:219 (+) Transcript_113868:985-1641(+)
MGSAARCPDPPPRTGRAHARAALMRRERPGTRSGLANRLRSRGRSATVLSVIVSESATHQATPRATPLPAIGCSGRARLRETSSTCSWAARAPPRPPGLWGRLWRIAAALLPTARRRCSWWSRCWRGSPRQPGSGRAGRAAAAEPPAAPPAGRRAVWGAAQAPRAAAATEAGVPRATATSSRIARSSPCSCCPVVARSLGWRLLAPFSRRRPCSWSGG